MKVYGVVLISLLAIALCVGAAYADPAPDVNAAFGNTCTGITVTPAPGTQGTSFTYNVAIANGATFNGNPVVGIKGLFVYVAGGGPSTNAPTNIATLAAGWNAENFQDQKGSFGWLTGNPANYVTPGTNANIGSATFSTSPTNMIYVVHVVSTTETGFCFPGPGPNPPPGVVPEPGSIALLGMGLLPLAGFLRKRRA